MEIADRGKGTGDVSDCLLWTGYKDHDGYGRRHNGRSAHQIAYEQAHGPIPPGMDVDHTCFVRACINPEHLRLLHPSVNRGLTSRSLKTRCVRGHPFDEANTYRAPSRPTWRGCRSCSRAQARAYYRAHRDQILAARRIGRE